MTTTDPVGRSVQDAIEQLIVDYPHLPVGVVIRTATAAVRSVTDSSDLDGDPGTVAYLIARQQLESITADVVVEGGYGDTRRGAAPRSRRS